MTEGREVPALDCPIGMKVCYPSCFFWRGKCDYEQIIKELEHRKEKEERKKEE
jgi:hypothetical protein